MHSGTLKYGSEKHEIGVLVDKALHYSEDGTTGPLYVVNSIWVIDDMPVMYGDCPDFFDMLTNDYQKQLKEIYNKDVLNIA